MLLTTLFLPRILALIVHTIIPNTPPNTPPNIPTNPMPKQRKTRRMPSPEEPSHENEAAQTLSQLSDFALRQSQTLSQFNEAVELQYRGGSQPSSHPLFGAPTPEFGPLGLSSQAGESIPAAPVAPVPKPIQHYSGDAPSNAPPGRLHRTARGTRRGPMDEMRQLARIMVKIIPHSVGFLVVSEEGGGAFGGGGD